MGRFLKLCEGGLGGLVLLKKGVYSYEYTDSWERSDETAVPDYISTKDFCIKDFEWYFIKNIFSVI